MFGQRLSCYVNLARGLSSDRRAVTQSVSRQVSYPGHHPVDPDCYSVSLQCLTLGEIGITSTAGSRENIRVAGCACFSAMLITFCGCHLPQVSQRLIAPTLNVDRLVQIAVVREHPP